MKYGARGILVSVIAGAIILYMSASPNAPSGTDQPDSKAHNASSNAPSSKQAQDQTPPRRPSDRVFLQRLRYAIASPETSHEDRIKAIREAFSHNLLSDKIISSSICSWISIIPQDTLVQLWASWPGSPEQPSLVSAVYEHFCKANDIAGIRKIVSHLGAGTAYNRLLQRIVKSSQSINASNLTEYLALARSDAEINEIGIGLRLKINTVTAKDRLATIQSYLDASPPDQIANHLIGFAVSSGALATGPKLYEWVSSLPTSVAASADRAIVQLAADKEVIDFIQKLADDGAETRASHLLPVFSERLLKKSPESAATWALSLPETFGNMRTQAITTAFISLYKSDRQLFKQQLSAVSDAGLRDTIEIVVRAH